jgi:hypothetical protein
MQFPMFEFLRGWIWKRRHRRRAGTSAWTKPEPIQRGIEGTAAREDSSVVEVGLVNGVAAALSGSVAATLTTSADVVKTRVMIGAGDTSNRSYSRSPTSGGLEMAKTILRESGIRGLFRGAMLRATWAALGSGLYLGSYEATKMWLRRRAP